MKGKSEISFERAIALANYYNVSLDYIAERTNSKKGLSFGEITADQQMLLSLICELSETEKENMSVILKQLLKVIKK